MKVSLAALDCIAFGVRFRLTSDSDTLLARMLECVPFGTKACMESSVVAQSFGIVRWPGGVGYRMFAGDEMVTEDAVLQAVLSRLATDLMVHVANHAPDHIFMHAGVVGWRDRALVLPGASFAGKTTLVAELVRAGAAYYSDEYAVVDASGKVHPYARDLQMRQSGSPVQTSLAVTHLNGTIGTTPLGVSRVVFTRYAVSGRWAAEPVSAGMAVLEMMRHTIPVQRAPAHVMATLARMMEAATALRSDRGEADKAAGALLRAMDGG